jgi:hypothetical protein
MFAHRTRGALGALSKKWSAVLATGGVGLALVIAGCGGSANPPHSPSAGGGAPVTTIAAPTKAPAASTPSAGIPQHNGGDQDADNNGGPSDGDGTI